MTQDQIVRQFVGRCSLCGGYVSLPSYVGCFIPTCESCKAVMDATADLPVLPMKKQETAA